MRIHCESNDNRLSIEEENCRLKIQIMLMLKKKKQIYCIFFDAENKDMITKRDD